MGNNMENIHALLSNSRIFLDINKESIKAIFPFLSGNIKLYHKGEFFIWEDDILNSIGIVLQGKLCITKMFIDGSQTLIQKASPSYAIGIDVVCTRSRISPYSVLAMEESKIFLIPYDIIRKPGRVDENIRLTIIDNILTIISHENIRKTHTLEILAKKSLRDKITTYLLRQKKKNNSSTFTIQLNREQLAEYLCVNRSALSHELALMQKEGLIQFSKNKFTIYHKYII